MLVNHWHTKTGHKIQQLSDEQIFDDYNHQDGDGNPTFSIETYDFVDDQQDYGIDIDIKNIYKIEAHDATKTEPEGWYDLELLARKDIDEDRFAKDSGLPSQYWIGPGLSFQTDCPVDIAKADKYRVTYTRGMHLFAPADTDAIPGYHSDLHPILIFGPTRDWALLNNKDGNKNGLISLCTEKLGDDPYNPTGLFLLLDDIYNKRDKNYRPMIKRKYNKYG